MAFPESMVVEYTVAAGVGANVVFVGLVEEVVEGETVGISDRIAEGEDDRAAEDTSVVPDEGKQVSTV